MRAAIKRVAPAPAGGFNSSPEESVGEDHNAMQKITPHLWFDKEAREAAELYVSLFPGSKITNVTTLTNTPSGDCDILSFELAGQPFMAISAGPLFKFNPSVSFHINCSTTQEVDSIWERLSPGGKILMPLGTYPLLHATGRARSRKRKGRFSTRAFCFSARSS
jgi:predicted 3-demethylubiquinone-9 3-methyltransferase (glyoxalase superfamily)